MSRYTGNNITRVHGILVFNEAEAIHELHLHDLASAMSTEVILDIGLCGCTFTARSVSKSSGGIQRVGPKRHIPDQCGI